LFPICFQQWFRTNTLYLRDDVKHEYAALTKQSNVKIKISDVVKYTFVFCNLKKEVRK